MRHNAPDKLTLMEDRDPKGRVTYRFWQRGAGYDRNLWTPKHIWKAIDYIHLNPVRRKLVEKAVHWKWSSAAWYELGQPTPLTLDPIPSAWLLMDDF